MPNDFPVWVKAPRHKREVVPTSRGWEVKDTGELLVSVRNLDQRLKELASTPTVLNDNTHLIELPEGTVEPTPNQIPSSDIVITPMIVVESGDVSKLPENTTVIAAENVITVQEVDGVTEVKNDIEIKDEPKVDEIPEQIVVEPKAEIVDGVQEQPIKRRGRPKKVQE